ncbi:MAG: DUF3592 domain-containing protein [Sphingomonas sp.]|uniref:DUF3592 domain-containing protein n=1 Tax=Sphingomonas sp. TaxID=28214 RepID=UPI003566CEC8
MSAEPFSPSNIAALAAMIAGGSLCTGYAVLAWHRRTRAAERVKDWASVTGEIVSVEVIVTSGTDDDDDYEARVRYAYHAAGRRFTGDRLRVGARLKSSNEAMIRAAVAPYRAGARIRVHYDPARPGQSVLEPVPVSADLKTWLIGGIFLLAASAYVAVTLIFPSPF